MEAEQQKRIRYHQEIVILSQDDVTAFCNQESKKDKIDHAVWVEGMVLLPILSIRVTLDNHGCQVCGRW